MQSERYVNNLNDKINVETLKKSLREAHAGALGSSASSLEVFAAFGGIIDIIAMKSLKRRGQASSTLVTLVALSLCFS